MRHLCLIQTRVAKSCGQDPSDFSESKHLGHEVIGEVLPIVVVLDHVLLVGFFHATVACLLHVCHSTPHSCCYSTPCWHRRWQLTQLIHEVVLDLGDPVDVFLSVLLGQLLLAALDVALVAAHVLEAVAAHVLEAVAAQFRLFQKLQKKCKRHLSDLTAHHNMQ